MKNFNKVALITIVAVTSAQAFAHGWQTKPISRAEFLYKTNPAAVGYEPQSVASLLTSGGSSSYADIKSFVGGPLGFFKKNHDIQSGALCTNGHSNWLSLLNAIAPTSVVNGQSMTISWTNTAPHRPSNYFVFITNYKAGEYNQAPSWQDLHYVSGCDLNGEGVGAANILPTTTWPCKMQLDNQNIVGKQVMVTIWQRVDPVGENFISCSDLNFGGSVVTPPQDLWTPVASKSWISGITQPTAKQTVKFTILKNGSALKTYSLSVTSANLDIWDSILADQINNDFSLSGLISVGEFNKTTQKVTYNSTNQNIDYVYLNTALAHSSDIYTYTITKAATPSTLASTWSPIGYSLKQWLLNVKKGDVVSFSLNKNAIEIDSFNTFTVTNLTTVEKQLAAAINAHLFNNAVKVRAGVLSGTTVKYVAGGDNKIHVYLSSNNTDSWSYVVRVNSVSPTTSPSPTPSPVPSPTVVPTPQPTTGANFTIGVQKVVAAGIYINYSSTWSSTKSYGVDWSNAAANWAPVYPVVQYSGSYYLACWNPSTGELPSSNNYGAWRLFTGAKNPCN